MNELDKAAAERVMGWELRPPQRGIVFCGWWSGDCYIMAEDAWKPCADDDMNQAAMVVSEIERRGLQQQFIAALWHTSGARCVSRQVQQDWLLATAPAEARVRAALEATKACDE